MNANHRIGRTTPPVKRLVVNADDFGYTPGVNRGIVAAFTDGIVRASTLMAVAPHFADAVALARHHPGLDLGVHLVLAGRYPPLTAAGTPLAPGGSFHRSLADAVRAILATPTATLRAELRAQIDTVLAAGIKPSHLDSHKQTHLVPRVWRLVVELAGEYAIPFVRRPGDTFTVPLDYPVGEMVGDWAVRGLAEYCSTATPVRTLPHFYGQRAVGHLEKLGLLRMLERLPEGATELMVHPGYPDAELAATSRLVESRRIELAALCDPQLRETVAARGIVLTSFCELAAG